MPTAAFADEWNSIEGVPLDATAAQETQGTAEPVPIDGEAIVLYRVDDGAEAESRIAPLSSNELSANDAVDAQDAAPLQSSGFEVAQTWDFSPTEAYAEAQDEQDAANARARNATNGASGSEASSADDASAADDADVAGIPSGDDVRIAYVTKDGVSAEDLVAELEALPYVIAAQPNYLIPLSSVSIDDTYYEDWQGYLHDAESAAATDNSIDLEAALAKYEPSSESSSIVAVIDSGVDYTNPDLAENMWTLPERLVGTLPGDAGSYGYDFGNGDDDPMPMDSLEASHGTHCAGIIAAETGNGEGIAGIAQDTQIMALKAQLDSEGASGSISVRAIISSYGYLTAAKLAGENVVAANNWLFGVSSG